MKKKVFFHRSRFLVSALEPDQWPAQRLFEIAIVGRSNVGKSSLINHFLESKQLAKVSSKPGKTRRINFFAVDHSLLIADLPGYGYAVASKKEQATWSYYIDLYLKKRPLSALLFLCDSRRSLNSDDTMLLEWAASRSISVICLLTKADKLSTQEQKTCLETMQAQMPQAVFFLYSIQDRSARTTLRAYINDHLIKKGQLRASCL